MFCLPSCSSLQITLPEDLPELLPGMILLVLSLGYFFQVQICFPVHVGRFWTFPVAFCTQMYFHAIFFRYCPVAATKIDMMYFYPVPATAEITDSRLISGYNALLMFFAFFLLSGFRKH